MINQEELQARQKKVGIYSFVVGFSVALFILVVFIMNNNTIKPPEVYNFKAVPSGAFLKYDFAPTLISLLNSQATTTATSTVTQNGSKKYAYSFYLNSETGSLPAGLKLGADGVLRGTPTEEGDNEFEICIKDTGGNSACRIYTMPVVPKTTAGTAQNTNSTGGSEQNKNVVQGTTRTEKWEGTYASHEVSYAIPGLVCTFDTTAPISICMTWKGQNFEGPWNFPNGFKDKETSYAHDPDVICLPPIHGMRYENGDQANGDFAGHIDSSGNLKLDFLTFEGSPFVGYPGDVASAVMTGNSMTAEFSNVHYNGPTITGTEKGSFTLTKVSDSCK